MDKSMFCYQCEQTFRGTGCVDYGVCGKDTEIAALQDLLVYQLQGLAYYGWAALEKGVLLPQETHRLVIDALFATLTNVSFDARPLTALLRQVQAAKEDVRGLARRAAGSGPAPMAALYNLPESDEAILRDAQHVNIRPFAAVDPDQQSLKDTLLYGLKGMAAYASHAWVLGYRDENVNRYLYRGLAATLDDCLGTGEMLPILLEFGQVNLKCMELLDQANTGVLGSPEPTMVRMTPVQGPFIVVSGHDLHDLKQLLEQTVGKGVNIYTHGEMLPAHAYPELKKYSHLVGHYGSAWQNQQREFDNLPGAILMTTNCLIEPRESYSGRLFTTGVVAWPEIAHIAEREGAKDFSPVVEAALTLGGWPQTEPSETILVGFGHAATLNHAAAIIDAVKTGQIRHFFLVGGCDGARPGRNYYTDFAEQTPADTVVLTLGCGKFRFNRHEFGTVAGLPRLLDVGQCNDAYSAIRVAQALAGAFECGVNDLPLTLVLSWFEQKAVCILLTLLSLGMKNIYIGPSLPAFLSPNVLNLLVETYDLHPVSTPEADLAAMLG
jgi:hydroxylamine reductase